MLVIVIHLESYVIPKCKPNIILPNGEKMVKRYELKGPSHFYD